MKAFRIIIFLFLMAAISSYADEVDFFKGTYAEAFEKAKREHKLVFIDFRADWCKPCIEMEQTTFKDSSVASIINTYFVPFKADVDYFEGMDVKEKYNVNQYPTLLVVNQYDEVQIRMIGFKPASILSLELKEILAMNEIVILEEHADDVYPTETNVGESEQTTDTPPAKKSCKVLKWIRKD